MYKISIIIPTCNEAANIAQLISRIKQRSSSENIAEIIVADSSEDSTAKKAIVAGAKIVTCKKRQRAHQLNMGAKIAKGDVLYFLHADSLPPAGFDKDIILAISRHRLAGCFRLEFDDKHWFLRLLTWFTRFSWGFIRFGDQSLFVQRKLFVGIGGYNEDMSILEDLEIVERLRQKTQFAVLPGYIVTSARKYQQYGYYRLQLRYTNINIAYQFKKLLARNR